VTPAAGRLGSSPAGLLGKLLAVVRPEFRVEVYLPGPDDPVLGWPVCSVPGCDRSRWQHGLCASHSRRWQDQGRPERDAFLANPGPELNGRRELLTCTVPGCRFGSSGLGLCMRHRGGWARSDQPDPALWASSVPRMSADGRSECQLPFCTVWVENERRLFCKAHHTRWDQLGRPDPEQYVAHCVLRGRARIDFSILAPQLRLEFQYAIQCRHDQQTITTPPPVVTWGVRLAANAGVGSLLDHDDQRWRELTAAKANGWYQGFVLHAREAVERLRDGTGWEVEYPRDVWRLHTLPGLTQNAGKNPDARHHLRFDRIAQPWLRPLVKRWARLRLTSGLAIGTVVADVASLIRFSTFLSDTAPPVSALAQVDRSLLERYLAWRSTQPGGQGIKASSWRSRARAWRPRASSTCGS
jgi:hypothetical protein